MLANVLSSEQAVCASIEVVRAFSRLRTILSAHKELCRRLDQLEQRYDAQFKVVFDAIRQLMEPEAKPVRRIGFRTWSRVPDAMNKGPKESAMVKSSRLK